jgi:hypothetical protein
MANQSLYGGLTVEEMIELLTFLTMGLLNAVAKTDASVRDALLDRIYGADAKTLRPNVKLAVDAIAVSLEALKP